MDSFITFLCVLVITNLSTCHTSDDERDNRLVDFLLQFSESPADDPLVRSIQLCHRVGPSVVDANAFAALDPWTIHVRRKAWTAPPARTGWCWTSTPRNVLNSVLLCPVYRGHIRPRAFIPFDFTKGMYNEQFTASTSNLEQGIHTT